MSLFPRSFISEASPASSSFHPLFRLLDDFDNYRTGTVPSSNNSNSASSQFYNAMKTFTPKFDVREVGEVYELHGDLPGIAQKDIEIEFTDDSTLTIKGRTERSYTSGTPPSAAGAIENGSGPAKQIEHKDHQPTVEDEDAGNTSSTVAKTGNNNNDVAKSNEPKAKYWVSERSVGEFARSFTFPVRVDQDGVKASMKNGVLSLTVPKAKKSEARKIQIQ
jgi:HSP20 family protein